MIYFIEAEGIGRIKIGYSSSEKGVFTRLRRLGEQCPAKLNLLQYMPGTKAIERRLHEAFKHARANGEWFHDTPRLRQLMSDMEGAGPLALERAIAGCLDEMQEVHKRVEGTTHAAQEGLSEAITKDLQQRVSAFILKYGTALTAYITGSCVASPQNWRRGSSLPLADKLLKMVWYDSAPFVGILGCKPDSPSLSIYREKRNSFIVEAFEATLLDCPNERQASLDDIEVRAMRFADGARTSKSDQFVEHHLSIVEDSLDAIRREAGEGPGLRAVRARVGA